MIQQASSFPKEAFNSRIRILNVHNFGISFQVLGGKGFAVLR
jgi:hypothetical protein